MASTELKHLAKLIKSEKDPNLLGQPKYAQLADHISHMIEAGEWKPGDRLPSEAEMAKVLPWNCHCELQRNPRRRRVAQHGC